MAVNLGSSNITTIKLGATDVSKIYLGSDVVFGGSAPFDSDAIAFWNANGTTGSIQQSAINQLVLDLKGGSNSLTTNKTDLWTKIFALYPYAPIDDSTATLNAYKYNLLNPLDTDAAFRMLWVNAPSPTLSGVIGGSGKYGITYFNVFNEISVNAFTLLVGLSTENTSTQVDAGAIKTSGAFDGCQIVPYFSGSDFSFVGRLYSSTANVNRIGLQGAMHDGTNSYKIKDGNFTFSSTVSAGIAQNENILTLARNLGATANGFSTKTQNFMVIADVLTANEVQDLNDAYVRYSANIITGGR